MGPARRPRGPARRSPFAGPRVLCGIRCHRPCWEEVPVLVTETPHVICPPGAPDLLPPCLSCLMEHSLARIHPLLSPPPHPLPELPPPDPPSPGDVVSEGQSPTAPWPGSDRDQTLGDDTHWLRGGFNNSPFRGFAGSDLSREEVAFGGEARRTKAGSGTELGQRPAPERTTPVR